MAPPAFKDIGKSADDLFSDDFGASNKFTFKSKGANGSSLKIDASHASGKVSGSVESKFKCPFTGLTIKEKWSSKNVVSTEVGLGDKLVKGSDVTFSGDFSPSNNGFDNFKAKTSYKADSFTFNADFTPKNTTVSGVFGYKDWSIGAQTKTGWDFGRFDSSISLGYTQGKSTFATNIKPSAVTGSVFHSACDNCQVGATFGWNKSGTTNFGVAGKYNLDSSSYLKAKVNSDATLNFSYGHKLSKSTSARVSLDVAEVSSIGLNITVDN